MRKTLSIVQCTTNLPIGAFAPPMMRVFFTLLIPHPSSGVSKRPLISPSPDQKGSKCLVNRVAENSVNICSVLTVGLCC